MSEAKFTKGNWNATCVSINGKEVKNGWSVDINGFTLASIYTGPTYGIIHEQQKANAHLIAAAPKMYKLLSEIKQVIDNGHELGEMASRIQDFDEEIDSLLKEARGEQ